MPPGAVIGRPWTREEDDRLTTAVAIHGEYTEKWKTIAQSVPGRTNKACRKRWLHSLSPNVKKSAWTAEEDRLLLSLYATHPGKWSVIARSIPGRTDDACSKRYREALDPSLKKDEWTEDEDARLLESYGRLGGKWGTIGHELGRSGLGCRNRWRLLERKRNAKEKERGGHNHSHTNHHRHSTSQPNALLPPFPNDSHSITASAPHLVSQYATNSWPNLQSSEQQSYCWDNIPPWTDVPMASQPAPDAYGVLLAAQSQAVHQQPGPSHVHMEVGATGGHNTTVSIQHPQSVHSGIAVNLGMDRPQDTGATPPFSFASSSLNSALTEPVAHEPVSAVNQSNPNYGGMTAHHAHSHSQSSPFHMPIVRSAVQYGSMHVQSPVQQQEVPMHVMIGEHSVPGHDRQNSVHAEYSSESPHSSVDAEFPMHDHHFEPFEDVDMGDMQNLSANTTVESSPAARNSSAERDFAAVLTYLPTAGSSSSSPHMHQVQIIPQASYTQPHSPTQLSPGQRHRASPIAYPIEITSRSSSSHLETSSPPHSHSQIQAQTVLPPTQLNVNTIDVTAEYIAQLHRRESQLSRPNIMIETLTDIHAAPGVDTGGAVQTPTTGTGKGRAQNPPKLSSKLPVADDPNVLAYACGHPHCWPDGAAYSMSRFCTSGELSTHVKALHPPETAWQNTAADAPYRCGLEGCGKGWKSVNGLQYHLQISKAHFRRALSLAVNQKELREAACAAFTASSSSEDLNSPNSPAPASPATTSSAPKRKLFRCPRPDCPNQYKQKSGLRYHLQHGHPRNSPTQLDVVPPAIARKVGVESTLHSPRVL